MSEFDPVEKLWHGPKAPINIPTDVNLGDEILRILSKSPESIMVISHEENYSMSRGEARELIIKVAENLINLNIKPGDFVGLICKNSKYVPVLFYAAIVVGAPVIPLDVSIDKEEMKKMLHLTNPKIIFCDHDAYETTKEVLFELNNEAPIITLLERIPDVKFIEDLTDTLGDITQFTPPKYDKPANEKVLAILLTSGTTGPSKGCCFSHATILRFIRADTPAIMESVSLNFSSMQWASGFFFAICLPLLITETRVQSQKPFNVDTFVEVVEKYKINSIVIHPNYLYSLVKSPRFATADLSSVKVISYSGSVMSQELRKTIRDQYPAIKLLNIYSLSEVGVAMCLPHKQYKNEDTAGSLNANVTVKIIDDDGNKLGIDECGEILAKPAMPFGVNIFNS